MNLYLRVLKYVKPYRLVVILALFSSLLYVLMNAFSIWMISSLIGTIMNSSRVNTFNSIDDYSIYKKLDSIVNNLIGSGNQLDQLQQLCIILVIAYIFKNVFYYINNVSISFVQNRMIMDIRNQLFIHLQKLPLSFFNKNKSGELSSIIMNDVSSMRVAFTQSIQSLIMEPVNIIVLIVMLFIISDELTILVLFTFPLTAYIISKLGQSIRRKAKRSSLSIAGVMNILQETLNGIRIVKAFVNEKFEVQKFLNENTKYYKLVFKQDNMRNLVTPINDLIGVFLGIILLWFGAKEVLIHGTLSSEGFIRFIIYLFAMLQPARKLGNVNAQIQAGLASAERVFSIIDVQPNIIESNNPIRISDLNKGIEFKNVSFQYENSDKPSLKNISFKIPKGKIIALVGSSGSGKTTTVDLIPRFFDVSSGAILLDNIDIKNIAINDIRLLMGIVSQDTILFNDTIKNNICYGSPNATLDDVIKASESANAIDFINELPNTYDTIVGEKGTRLSGGQKQRIAIARAILRNPKILILDEATSSLDTESEQKVQDAIDKLVKDRTVIVIAHRLSTIIQSDSIVVLENGQIIENGTHKDLLSMDGQYKKLYNIQFGDNIKK